MFQARGRSSSGRAPPCQGGGSEFEPRRPLHVGASYVSLAPAFFKSQSALTPLLLLSKSQLLTLGCDLGTSLRGGFVPLRRNIDFNRPFQLVASDIRLRRAFYFVAKIKEISVLTHQSKNADVNARLRFFDFMKSRPARGRQLLSHPGQPGQAGDLHNGADLVGKIDYPRLLRVRGLG